MTIDQRVEAYRMRLEGKTFEEIGEHFGVSRQHIQQTLFFCKGPRGLDRSVKSCVYPNIARWMMENRIGISKFSERCGMNQATLRLVLSVRGNPRKGTIDKILRITGLSYEEAFYLPKQEGEANAEH